MVFSGKKYLIQFTVRTFASKRELLTQIQTLLNSRFFVKPELINVRETRTSSLNTGGIKEDG